MSGNYLGAAKSAAKRIGVPFGEYTKRIARGERWCIGCRAFHPQSDFGLDRNRSDGWARRCNASRRIKR